MSSRTLEIKITGDSSSLNRALGGASKDADHFGSKVGGVASGAVKGLGLAAGAAAVGGLALLAKGFVDGMHDLIAHEKLMKQTEAVIKSTGGGAGVTAKHVDGLADSIEKMSGMDGDAIQSGENMLLTFTNIKNGVGAGSKVFDQATRTLADMSTAMGADPQKQAVMLGKALNDPIAGVGALSKVGVTFTEGQKASIKAMVEHGNTAGAQKVILAELGKEFGGSAKAAGTTMAGQVKILQAHLSDLEQEIAAKVLPVLNRLIQWAIANWPTFERIARTAIRVIGDAWDQYGRPAIATIQTVIAALVGFVRDHWEQISNLIEADIRVIQGIIDTVMAVIHGDWDAAWQGIQDTLSGILDVIIADIRLFGPLLLTAAQAVGQALWDGFTTLVGNIPGWLGQLLAALPGVFVAALGLIGTAAGQLAQAALDAIGNLLGQLGTLVAGWITGGIQSITNGIVNAGAQALALGQAIVTNITTAAGNIATTVGGFIAGIPGAISTHVAAVGAQALALGTRIVTDISGAIDHIAGTVGGFIAGIPEKIRDHLAGVGAAALAIGNRIVSDVAGGLGDLLSTVGGFIRGIPQRLREVLQDIGGSLATAAGAFGQHIVSGILSGLGGLLGDLTDYLLRQVRAALDAANPANWLSNPGTKTPPGGQVPIGKAAGDWITSPMLSWIGEDAPTWPEVVIPTNPAHRGRAQTLLGQANAMIGGRGGGDTYITIYQQPGESTEGLMQRLHAQVRTA